MRSCTFCRCKQYIRRSAVLHGQITSWLVVGDSTAILSWERDSNGHLTKTMSFRTSLEMHAFHEETSTTAWAKPHVGWWLVSCDVLVVGERPQLTDTSLAKRCACTLGMHALQEEISNAACTKSRGGWWLVVGVLRCSRGVRKTSIYRLTTNDSFRLHSLGHARVAPRDTQCRIH